MYIEPGAFLLFFCQMFGRLSSFENLDLNTHPNLVSKKKNVNNVSIGTSRIRVQYFSDLSLKNGLDIWAFVRKACEIRVVAFNYSVSVYDKPFG